MDYKLIAKVLSNRLAKMLGSLIAEDQTCAVPGRTILGTCHVLRDLIQLCEEDNLPVALLSIDQMKAFDRVNWDFLLKVLEKMNFGPTFIEWIKILYTGIQSRVKVNGYVSEPFHLERGVRQGCPLSPLLYVLAAEVFAESVRHDKQVKGITVEKTEFKILQYADDTTLILSGDKSILQCAKHIQLFEKASGAKINLEKSKGLWLGSYKGRADSPLGFDWENKSLKILGITYGTIDTEKQNWEAKVSKFERTLDRWRGRALSFRGKGVVVNQLASSVLWYTAAIFPIPQWAIKRVNTKLWEFVYDGKKDPISRSHAKLPYKEGGLNIVDVELKSQSLILSWLSRLLDNKIEGKWKVLFEFFLGKWKGLQLGSNVLKCYLMQQSLKDMPSFYKTALECFIRFTKPNRVEPKQVEQIYNEPLFQNALTAKESLLVEESWTNSGISLLRHICYEYVPGFLSEDAIKELIGGEYRRGSLGAVVRQLPKEWVEIVNSIPAPASRISENFEVLLVNNETKTFSKLNSKAIYDILICNEKPTLVFKIYWETLLGPINWELVFENLFKSNDDRKCSDIQWKLLQHVTQTADRLCRHKILKNPKCQRCLVNDETEVHCFLYCPEVRKLWKKVASLITAYNPDVEIKKLVRFVVVGFLDVKKSNETHSVEKCLRDLAIKTIWSTRNAIVFDNEQKDLMSIYTGKLKRKIKNQFFLAKNRFDTLFNFQMTWCRNQVLAKVQNNTLEIAI